MAAPAGHQEGDTILAMVGKECVCVWVGGKKGVSCGWPPACGDSVRDASN